MRKNFTEEVWNGGSPGQEEGQVPAAKGTVSDFVHVFFCWEDVHTAFSPDDKEVETGDSSREQARDGELQEGPVIFVWEPSEAIALSWYGHFFSTFFNLLNSTYEQPARWLRASFSMYSEYVLPNFMFTNLHNLLTPNESLKESSSSLYLPKSFAVVLQTSTSQMQSALEGRLEKDDVSVSLSYER